MAAPSRAEPVSLDLDPVTRGLTRMQAILEELHEAELEALREERDRR